MVQLLDNDSDCAGRGADRVTDILDPKLVEQHVIAIHICEIIPDGLHSHWDWPLGDCGITVSVCLHGTAASIILDPLASPVTDAPCTTTILRPDTCRASPHTIQ